MSMRSHDEQTWIDFGKPVEPEFAIGQRLINRDPICLYNGREVTVKSFTVFRNLVIYTVETDGQVTMAVKEHNLWRVN